MSSYIKYYRTKDSESKEVTHEAYFIDARGHFPDKFKPSYSDYYVQFTDNGRCAESIFKEMKMEDFEEFIKDFEEVIGE